MAEFGLTSCEDCCCEMMRRGVSYQGGIVAACADPSIVLSTMITTILSSFESLLAGVSHDATV